MASGEEKSTDFYAVLGLKKECTTSELRNAYKKLALRWHPDRCSAPGNSKHVEEAKEKFQSIQDAYSVLSDASKRFMYDVGAYDDDDENGMGDFLGEMAVMMSQAAEANPNEKGLESFEDLQELFEEMFQRDIDAFPAASSQSALYSGNSHKDNENKRACSERSSNFDPESMEIPSFCIGAEGREDSKGKGGKGRRKNTSCRKPRPKIRIGQPWNTSTTGAPHQIIDSQWIPSSIWSITQPLDAHRRRFPRCHCHHLLVFKSNWSHLPLKKETLKVKNCRQCKGDEASLGDRIFR